MSAGGSSRTFTGTGTAAAPVIFRGVNAPRFTGVVTISGSYVIVEGIDVDGGGVNLSGNHVALRDSEVQRVNNRGTATWVNGGNDVVIFRNRIHDNGVFSNSENDRHGVGGGGNRIWILDNEIFRNSGDGVQFGHQARNQFGHIYIGRNTMYGDRENAVDIKEVSNVVISQNTMSGYRASSSSEGAAVVVHDCPINTHVIFNTILDSHIGISSASLSSTCPRPVNVRFIGNVIENITGAAIQGWGSGKITAVVGNTIVGVGSFGIGLDNLSAGSVIENNLLWQVNGQAIGTGGSVTVRNNLADIMNPLFTDDGGHAYRLLIGSPAIDAGRLSGAYAAHRAVFGELIDVDHSGAPRPQGGQWDIGAHEYLTP